MSQTSADRTRRSRRLGLICGDPCLWGSTRGDEQISPNVTDFLAFLHQYDLGEPMADMNDDGVLNVFDVTASIVKYARGCR